MKKHVYLVKETILDFTDIGRIQTQTFKSLDVYAFLNRDKALKFIESNMEGYISEHKDSKLEVWRDGFDCGIVDYNYNQKLLYDVDFMTIEGDEIPQEIYVYTEVNTYASGEVYPHAVGCLTKEDAIKEMVSEINNREDEDMDDNYYWISDGSVEEEHVELEDEMGNISYLDYSRIILDSNN